MIVLKTSIEDVGCKILKKILVAKRWGDVTPSLEDHPMTGKWLIAMVDKSPR